MKYKHIMTYFGIALPVCLVLRTLQALFMTDTKGFTASAYAGISFKILVVLCAAVVATAVIGALTHRCPLHAPKITLPLGISAVALGIWTMVDLAFSTFTAAVPKWQIVLLYLFGFLCSVVFIAYGAGAFFDFKLPPLLFVIPVLFWIIRLISVFTTLSTLALTAGHLFLLAAYCAVLVFMLELAKMMNGLDRENNFKKLLASGLCSVLLCGISTVPYFFVFALGRTEVVNESTASLGLTFLTGVFCWFFLSAHFSAHNLKAHKHHHNRARFIPESGNTDQFYTGYSGH